MSEPISGSAGKQQQAAEAVTQPMAVVADLPPGLALPEIGPAEQYLVDVYDRTYAKLPGKCAQRRSWAVREAQAAQEAGDERRAADAARHAACYQAVLDKHERCRRCGRPLRHPLSIARRIGPECWEKEP